MWEGEAPAEPRADLDKLNRSLAVRPPAHAVGYMRAVGYIPLTKR